jgi:hypothetical protein
MTWKASLAANHTDGILIPHEGRILYERYFGCLDEAGKHGAMSLTKSVAGLLGEILAAEGVLDETARVGALIPELADSAFGAAYVRQVLDMTTGLRYSEHDADPEADVRGLQRRGQSAAQARRLSGSEQLLSVPADHAAGRRARRGVRPQDDQHRGAGLDRLAGDRKVIDRPAVRTDLDPHGGGAGRLLHAGLHRDTVRRRQRPGHVVGAPQPQRRLRRARGDGRTFYVDPTARMASARFPSHPVAGNAANDPASLPVFQAVADYLTSRP